MCNVKKPASAILAGFFVHLPSIDCIFFVRFLTSCVLVLFTRREAEKVIRVANRKRKDSAMSVTMQNTLTGVRAMLASNPEITTKRIEDVLAVTEGRKVAVDPAKGRPIEKAYTARDVAELLGISVKGVQYHARMGRLVRVANGKYSGASVRALLEGKKAAA